MDSLGINQVDVDNWFLSMKHTSKEPHFSKQGIHWSVYGAILAEDTLVKFMEQRRHIRMPHPAWSEIVRTNMLREGDNDVAADLNLIFPEADETMSYPVLKDEPPDSTKKKPKVIYLGDSFAFKLLLSGKMDKLNSECEYWGYFDEVHGIKPDKFTYIRNYDWKAALDKTDCLVLIYTTFNYAHLGDGFIEAAYDHYYPAKE